MQKTLWACLFWCAAASAQAGSIAYLSEDQQGLPAVVCGYERGGSVYMKYAVEDMRKEVVKLKKRLGLTDAQMVVSAPALAAAGVTAIEASACVTITSKG